MSVFNDAEIDYLKSQRLGRLATVGRDGMPASGRASGLAGGLNRISAPACGVGHAIHNRVG